MTLFKKKDEKETEKKPQQPQYYRAVTGGKALNYCVYYMSVMEKAAYFVLAFAVGAVVGYLFYGGIGKDEYGNPTMLTHIINVAVMVLCGFVAGKMFIPIRTNQILESRKRKLKTQFRDMLEALTTAFGAGKNVREAFQAVQEDMENQYEEDAFINQELRIINNGFLNGFTIEEMLLDLGRRSGNEDIMNFADVFDICFRQGGNIRDAVRNSASIISDKMAIAEEIETVVSGSKSEQMVMLVMPVGLVGMIKLSSPDFAQNFTTSSGIMATTISIGLFVLSYFIGRKLLDIKI